MSYRYPSTRAYAAQAAGQQTGPSSSGTSTTRRSKAASHAADQQPSISQPLPSNTTSTDTNSQILYSSNAHRRKNSNEGRDYVRSRQFVDDVEGQNGLAIEGLSGKVAQLRSLASAIGTEVKDSTAQLANMVFLSFSLPFQQGLIKVER